MENIVCTKKVEIIIEVTREANLFAVWARQAHGALGAEPGRTLVEWVPAGGDDSEREALRLQDQFIKRLKVRVDWAIEREEGSGEDQRINERALDAGTVAKLLDGKVAA